MDDTDADLRPDWGEWKDLKFVAYLAHGDYIRLARGEDEFNGFYSRSCTCGGWRRFYKTDSGHREDCPTHMAAIESMNRNPR